MEKILVEKPRIPHIAYKFRTFSNGLSKRGKDLKGRKLRPAFPIFQTKRGAVSLNKMNPKIIRIKSPNNPFCSKLVSKLRKVQDPQSSLVSGQHTILEGNLVHFPTGAIPTPQKLTGQRENGLQLTFSGSSTRNKVQQRREDIMIKNKPPRGHRSLVTLPFIDGLKKILS